MSRRGNPYDNATMESFFKTLKYEKVYFFDNETIADVGKRYSFLIEEWPGGSRLASTVKIRMWD